MTERIMDLIQRDNGSPFFFAIGAAHLVGNNSVVDMLQQKGVTTERVTARDRIIPVLNTGTRTAKSSFAPSGKNHAYHQFQKLLLPFCVIQCTMRF